MKVHPEFVFCYCAVLTLATVIERLLALSTGGTKLLHDCCVSLMESCIHLKEVQEDGDDGDGAEDLDDDDEEEEDTDEDDEVTEQNHDLYLLYSCPTKLIEYHKQHIIRIRMMMMMYAKRQKRNFFKDMQRLPLVNQLKLLRTVTLMMKPKTLNWVNPNYFLHLNLASIVLFYTYVTLLSSLGANAGSLDEMDVQQVVLSMMKIRPDLIRAQTFPDGLMERMAETFPEYEQLFHVHRQALAILQ